MSDIRKEQLYGSYRADLVGNKYKPKHKIPTLSPGYLTLYKKLNKEMTINYE